MKKSDIKIMPEYFERYIRLVDDIELDDAFQNNLETLATIDLAKLKLLQSTAYAEGEWTVTDIFQHIIDTERVMAYRTLRYARRDGDIRHGYDQYVFASNATAAHSTLAYMLEELRQLHQATRVLV